MIDVFGISSTIPEFSLLNAVIIVLWSVGALFDYAAHMYRWQIKWYRVDRFYDFLQTSQGKKYLYSYSVCWRAILAIVVSFWPINSVPLLKYLILAFFSIDIIRHVWVGFKKKLRRPVITKKVILITTLALALEAMWIIWSGDWAVFITVLILRAPIAAGSVILINLGTDAIKRWYFFRARKKLARFPNCIVIGVTGSYGKTSVKEFLSGILEKKFRVIKTPKNINSDIGIASFILQSDLASSNICVVEIGAYKRGDIALVCNMIHPSIGILTAINEQHLSLFGSIQHTQAAKYELLRSLPKNGLAITNSDNPLCREFLGELTAPVQTFGTEADWHPACRLVGVHTENGKILCQYLITTDQKEKMELTCSPPFIGEHQAMNIAPCLLVAHHLGMSMKDIAEAVSTLKNPAYGVHTYRYGKTTIIDDSHNSNPNGFLAALDVLSTYPSDRRRVVITRGMMELGEKSDELHEKIANNIAFIADELIVITPDFVEPLQRGLLGEKYRTTFSVITNPEALCDRVRTLKKTHSVILIENRIFESLRKELTPETP